MARLTHLLIVCELSLINYIPSSLTVMNYNVQVHVFSSIFKSFQFNSLFQTKVRKLNFYCMHICIPAFTLTNVKYLTYCIHLIRYFQY